jgi:capsular exopolysaccharide synthesis family protein
MIIHERAEPASSPGKPNLRLNLILGVAVGLVFSLFLAFFIEYLDTSVKSLEDVENALEVPVLGVIPKGISVLSSQSSDTPDAEAYRIIRTNIEFNRRSADDNAITLISGGAGEGKSTTLFNLAYTFAQGGYNVLVVDADLRRPAQHHFFNVDNTVGLTDYLTSDLSLEDVIVRTSLDNLSFMPSGHLPKDAVGILNSQRMSDMIAELKQHFDLVFFDSPPILGVSDASVLSSEVDLTVMVVQHRRFPKSMLQRVKNSVLNVGGTLLGVVLNNVDIKNDKSYDYYTAYYDYYYSKKRGGKEQPKLKNHDKELTHSSMNDDEDQY